MKPKKKHENLDLNFSTFDIEAEKWVNPLLIGFYDGYNYLTFNTVREFLDFILSYRFRGQKIYSHYGGGYDIRFLLDELEDYEYKIIDTNGRILMLKVFDSDNHNWYFCDSYSLLPQSLKTLSEGFNIKHNKMDFDMEEWKNNGFKVTDELKEYLKHDVIGLYEIIEKFKRLLWNKFKTNTRLTIASTSMEIFRTSYQYRQIFGHDYIEDKVRKAYFGGRCEVFRKEGENLYYYDVNSLYPYVYTNFELPVDRPKRKNYRFGKTGLIKGKFFVRNDIKFPILPYRDEKLLFPCGKFEGWVWSDEFQMALEKDQIIDYKIEEFWEFETEKILSEYGKDLYNLKKNSDSEAKYWLAKFLLNSIYGKFAQSKEKKQYMRMSGKEALLKADEEDIYCYDEEHHLYWKKAKSNAPYILPAISTAITSLARLELWKWINKAEKMGNNVYYCDTDSIITDGKFPSKYVDKKELGALDLEKTAKEGIFLSPKVYALRKEKNKAEFKAKGIDKSCRFEWEDFVKGLNGRPSSYEWNSIGKWKSSINRKNQFMQIMEMKRKLSIEDNKREWIGNTSIPIRIDETNI
ncbi:MAG: DNA polymerase [Promethearchaeia archaeon]